MTVEQIYQALGQEKFHQWYETDWDSYIVGDENCKSKEQILEDIRRLFGIKENLC